MSMSKDFMLKEDGYIELAKAVQSASGSITTCFLFTRLWARLSHRGLWWDDYILIAAWASLMIANGLAAAAPAYGWNVLTATSHAAALHFTSASFMYLATPWSKTAFAVTLLRLTSGWSKIVLWFIVILVNAFGVVMAAVSWWPLCNASFDYATLPNEKCMTMRMNLWLHIGCSISNIVADAILVIYPWIIVRRVQLSMAKSEKRTVAATMSLVGLSTLATIGKVTVQGLVPAEQFGELDWTYGCVVIFCFFQAEAAIMIIAQSFPIIRVLYLAKNESRAGAGKGQRKAKAARAPAKPSGRVSEGVLAEQSFPDIELIQLPTGRIVPAEEAIRLGHSDLVEAARAEQARPAEGRPTEVQAAAAEEQSRRESEDDEIHKIWTDLGLSTRAWSQSPPLAPQREAPSRTTPPHNTTSAR